LPAGEAIVTPSLIGYPESAKLLIINLDDAGMCHSINQAVVAALEHGLATSASLMAPAGWFSEIAEYAVRNAERDFGVHITLTSEWHDFRWRPVTGRRVVPGLCAPDGCMWPTQELLRAHARPEEVEIEARAQIECCLDMGIDLTHLDSHMDTLLLDDSYCAVFLRLAEAYDLPLRLLPRPVITEGGVQDIHDEALRKGILSAALILQDPARDRPPFLQETLSSLAPGVHELYIHAALGDEEFRVISRGGNREEDLRLFGPDRALAEAINEGGVELIGHRPIREAQRQRYSPPGLARESR
jgi:hypothetical protein